jgi:multiple sugar transport system ATP-binding protein
MAELQLKNVSKMYPNGTLALDDFNLDIKDKEFMVLVGPSGCGKSTVLRLITGLERASAGEIIIDGRPAHNLEPAERDIAFVFQNYALYPHMTVYANMAFALENRRMQAAEIEDRVLEAATILGIKDLLKRHPRELSGGQRQRVALGRAIVRQPKAFLLDEPLSNLDIKLRTYMRKEIHLLHRRLETTMVYVTHDQVEAMTLGDRLCILNNGRIQQVGTPLDIFESPANKFVASFLGSSPMNFLEGNFYRKEQGLVFENFDFQVPLPPCFHTIPAKYYHKSISMGLRPEHLFLAEHHEQEGYLTEARIELIERLGDYQLIYARNAQKQYVIKSDMQTPVQERTFCKIGARLDKAHFFLEETGQNINL